MMRSPWPYVLLLGLGCPPSPSAAPPRPAVLLLTIDTLRADHLGVYGGARGTSPAIDALAARAVVFDEAYSASSWTPPSVGSFLTGLLPSRHGMIGGATRLATGCETLAERLQAAGYRTAAWVQNTWLAEPFGFRQGFQHYACFDFSGDRVATADTERAVLEWLDRDSQPSFTWLHYLAPHVPYEPRLPWIDEFSPPTFDERYAVVSFPAMASHKSRPLDPLDLQRFMALYDSEIAATDHAIGRLLHALEQRDRLDPMLVVVLSDHGEEFKDHGGMGHFTTTFREVTRVPLLLKLPGQLAQLRTALPVSAMDLVPTLVEVLALPAAAVICDGLPLLQRVADGAPAAAAIDMVTSSLGRWRIARADDVVFTCKFDAEYSAVHALARLGAPGDTVAQAPDLSGIVDALSNRFCARDARFTLVCRTDRNDLEQSLTIDGRHPRAAEVPFLAQGRHYVYELYDRQADPTEQRDVIDAYPEQARRLARRLREALREAPGLPVTTDPPAELPPELLQRLRELGYLGGGK